MTTDKAFAALKFTSQKVCPVTYIMQVAIKYFSRCVWRFDDNVQICIVSKDGLMLQYSNYIVNEYKK